MPEHVLDASLAQCIALRETMRWLRDPVVFAPWPPAVPVVLPCSGVRMLRLREVERRAGLRKSQIYRDIAAARFPRRRRSAIGCVGGPRTKWLNG